MKILFSIIINAFTLFIIAYFLSENKSLWIESWISLWCGTCSFYSLLAWETYIVWWIILWIINLTIKPILKLLSLPLFFIFLWLVSFFINWIILYVFNYIMNDILIIDWIGYKINWLVNFLIAVAIFTIMNILYTFIFNKK